MSAKSCCFVVSALPKFSSKSEPLFLHQKPVVRPLLLKSPSVTFFRSLNVKSFCERSSTTFFHPNLWDDHFNASDVEKEREDTYTEQRREKLKKEVKTKLSFAAIYSPFQELELIDKLQRLGVAYHFEAEIEDGLERIFNDHNHFFEQNAADMYTVALRFRLLRQAGYHVLPDVFNKFKDEKGTFDATLTSDMQGMLSLYEASFLSFNGEIILDEANAFTTKHLHSMVSSLGYSLASQVQNSLKMPLQKSIKRVEARNQISIYQEDKFHNESLLEFAKLEYNRVQLIHRKEISEVKRWWEDVKPKIPYEVRDRAVEGYCMMMATYFEPEHSTARVHLAKMFMMLEVLDIAYEVYGDLRKLEALSDAFQRWDIGDEKDLTDVTKLIFLETLNVINEVEAEKMRNGGFNGFPYLKKEMKRQVKGFLDERKMLLSGDIPTLDEWLPISGVTVGTSLFLTDAVMNMGELATKEVFEWIGSMPKIIEKAQIIIRIYDDVGTFKREAERGNNLTTVSCYMKDHGVSEAEAIDNLLKMVTSLWKDMNQECLRPNPVPMKVLTTIYNLVRMMPLYYANGEDGLTNSKGRVEEIVASLLLNPILI